MSNIITPPGMKKKIKDPNDRKAGVTFTYKDCDNRVLHTAMNKVDEASQIFSGADLSRWMKIKATFDRHAKQVSRCFQVLIKKHAVHEPVLDPEGKPVKDKNGKPRLSPKMIPTGRGTKDFMWADEDAFKKDYDELMATEFKVEAYQLLTEDFMKAGLSAKEIRECAKMLSDADPELLDDLDELDEDEDIDSLEPSHVDYGDISEEAAESSESDSETLSNEEAPTHVPTPSDAPGASASV